MATQKQTTIETIIGLHMNFVNCIRHHRQENLETLTERQHRLLDMLVYDGMTLIRVATTMPSKKQVGYLVDNVINGMKLNIERIIPTENCTVMNALYASFTTFITYATVALEKYTH